MTISREQIETLRYTLKLPDYHRRGDTINALCDLALKGLEAQPTIRRVPRQPISYSEPEGAAPEDRGERRKGHSRLVYDKKSRTIIKEPLPADEVDGVVERLKLGGPNALEVADEAATIIQRLTTENKRLRREIAATIREGLKAVAEAKSRAALGGEQ